MKFTPIQRRLLEILKDGQPHTRKELWECLQDSLAKLAGINPHIMYLRIKLRAIGQDIVCEYVSRLICYRHVRHLNDLSPVGPASTSS